MATNRDPFFFACAHATHEGYSDDPEFALVNPEGELLLRTGEKIIKKMRGHFVMLRYPEERWLVQQEKFQSWDIYITSERVVGIHPVLFPGAFEVYDWLEEYGKFAGLHPTDQIEINQFFRWINKKDKILKNFSLIFQLANTRISSVSCIKMMGTDPSAVEFWYDDAPNASQTRMYIYPEPGKMTGEDLFNLGVAINGSALIEKERCLKKKHQIDPTWEAEEYNTHLAALQRLVRAPDFLAMGSPGLDDESFNPISFQPHPVQWCQEVFERTMDGTETIRIINLKY